MALQIANPVVVRKVELLARATGLSKTRAVERAVDLMLADTQSPAPVFDRVRELLAKLDAIPDRPDAHDPLEWDEDGLPV